MTTGNWKLETKYWEQKLATETGNGNWNGMETKNASITGVVFSL